MQTLVLAGSKVQPDSSGFPPKAVIGSPLTAGDWGRARYALTITHVSHVQVAPGGRNQRKPVNRVDRETKHAVAGRPDVNVGPNTAGAERVVNDPAIRAFHARGRRGDWSIFRPIDAARRQNAGRKHGPVPFTRVNGFTLIELLVVIIIIGILSGLITSAVMSARRRAIIASIVTDVKQLEAGCENYKSKFGEYPPDFTSSPNLPTYPNPDPSDGTYTYGEKAVLRHLAKAFPRYVPGITTVGGANLTGWPGFVADLKNGWGLDITANGNVLSPVSALTFWLGGQPLWKNGTYPTSNTATPITGFNGFSANPLNPFDNSTSRIQPFYDFNLNCLYYYNYDSSNSGPPQGLALWPSRAYDSSSKPTSPIVYFRSNSSTYFQDGSATAPKFCNLVFPAIDTRLSTPGNATTAASISWVNPSSVQIFSSGMDLTYGAINGWPNVYLGSPPTAQTLNVLMFPTGENYKNTAANPPNLTNTYDDITNFSGGTLNDAIP